MIQLATTYKELYDSVYSKIKDYDFVDMLEEDADEILHDYLRPAVVAFECCNQDLSDRDEDSQQFNITLNDVNFEILSNFMVIVYLDSTYIRTSLMLKAHMSTADFHKYDNKDVLSKVIEARDMYKRENKQWMINYSLRGESDFSKLYEKNGSYDVNKFHRVKRNHCRCGDRRKTRRCEGDAT